MPKPNFYMSDKDRITILHLITDYISMWEDCKMDDEEYEELRRVRNKIKNMHKSKGYKNATIDNVLEIANRVLNKKIVFKMKSLEGLKVVFMEVLLPEEELELSILVDSEYDKDIIKLTIINFPVSWDTIREILMCGWSVNRISAFCKEMCFKGKIIIDVWNVVKQVSTI